MIDAVVERPQLARAPELGAVARPIEDVCRPETVEILVDATRCERISRVETLIRGDVGKDDGQRPARWPQLLAQDPIERDGAADFVAVGQRLQQDVRPGAAGCERPCVGNAVVAGGMRGKIRESDLDLRNRCRCANWHAFDQRAQRALGSGPADAIGEAAHECLA